MLVRAISRSTIRSAAVSDLRSKFCLDRRFVTSQIAGVPRSLLPCPRSKAVVRRDRGWGREHSASLFLVLLATTKCLGTEPRPPAATLQHESSPSSSFEPSVPSDEDCRKRPACAAEGACHAWSPEMHEVSPQCLPASDADCVTSESCRRQGACRLRFSAEDPLASCVVASDADCQASSECEARGHCHWLGDRCVQPTRCRESAECTDSGACELLEGACRATSDEECTASNGCAWHGRCSAVEGACVVRRDADCIRSERCQRFGLCRAHEGDCIHKDSAPRTDEQCRVAEACRVHGSCAARAPAYAPDGPDIHCLAGKDSDCAASVDCRHHGACALGGEQRDRCEPRDDSDCRGALDCRFMGQCSRVVSSGAPGALASCRATADADCLAARSCSTQGRCAAVDGICQRRAAGAH